MFPSSGEGETPIPLSPLETANLNHWTTHVRITTAIYNPAILSECYSQSTLESKALTSVKWNREYDDYYARYEVLMAMTMM
jgi:hypothetical protein